VSTRRQRLRHFGCVVAAIAAGCSTPGPFDPLQIGAGFGYTVAELRLDRDDVSDPDTEFEPGEGLGGFLEIVAPDQRVDFHMRLQASRDDVPVRGPATDVEVTQGMALFLFSPRVPVGPLVLKPMFGVGAGFTDIDAEPGLDYLDGTELAASLALGFEVGGFGPVSVGGLGQTNVFGHDWDTAGYVDSFLFYVGVRF
jgi:hypothetical protein